MSVLEMLRAREKELEANKAVIDADLRDLAKAIAAIEGSKPTLKAAEENVDYKHPMPVDEAILIAIQNGCKLPTPILGYMRRKLGLHTTINSVRTRLGKMREKGRVGHGDKGWFIPKPDAKAST